MNIKNNETAAPNIRKTFFYKFKQPLNFVLHLRNCNFAV